MKTNLIKHSLILITGFVIGVIGAGIYSHSQLEKQAAAFNIDLQLIKDQGYRAGLNNHAHCIPESDICTMDKDQYDYYRVSIGDVDYKKYTAMCKRINYTYADQERDIQKMRQGH